MELQACHCEAREERRSNPRRISQSGWGLLRCARNDARGIWPALALVLAAAVATPAHAVRPDEMLADPAREARAREVSKELRCLVCRNQALDDSDADLAHDLRVLVRERIMAGDSNEQTLAYVRARYGDFVLLKPPFQTDTLLLWGGPLAILLLGGFAVRRFYRARAQMAAPLPLSADEQRRLAAVLQRETER
jgi:cytochrome c-type biogenesis protein CcmH